MHLATMKEAEAVTDMLVSAHKKSPYSHVPYERVDLFRQVLLAIHSPVSTCLYSDGAVLIGTISENMYGVSIAACTAVYSERPMGGAMLIREFIEWAHDMDVAGVVFMTSKISDDKRFGKLMNRMGVSRSGSNYEVHF